MTNYYLQPCTIDKWALFVFLHQDEGIFLLNSTCSVVIVSWSHLLTFFCKPQLVLYTFKSSESLLSFISQNISQVRIILTRLLYPYLSYVCTISKLLNESG